MKMIFENNNILYGQDMQFYRGIPVGVEFKVEKFSEDKIKLFSEDKIKLTAPNYGGKPYGNGAIYVCKEHLWSDLEDEIFDGIERKVILDAIKKGFEDTYDACEVINMEVPGSLISSMASLCVEKRLLEIGIFNKEGNDLIRELDKTIWKVKGGRSKSFSCIINQSYLKVDETYYLVYNGIPERKLIYGVYVFKGKDEYFTPATHGRNLRTFYPGYINKVINLLGDPV